MAKDLIASAADILNTPAYQGLLGRTLPRVIRTEAENQHYLDLLSQLDAHSNDLTPPEKDLADRLTLLIERFEEQVNALKTISPLEVLHESPRTNSLNQRDLLDAFGTGIIASEDSNDKPRFATDHNRKLNQRFLVSPELFL